jgi:hypothetical protein
MAKSDEYGPEPFADYLEWAENRLNPGHYLGGNLPPHLRKHSLGPRARRRAGILIAIWALVTFGLSVSTIVVSGELFTPRGFAVTALFAIAMLAGVRMFLAGRRATPRSVQ